MHEQCFLSHPRMVTLIRHVDIQYERDEQPILHKKTRHCFELKKKGDKKKRQYQKYITQIDMYNLIYM